MSSGDKCSYFHCDKSRRNDKDVRFHRFPADVTNSRIWLLNSGNSKLYNLRPEQLRKRYLCSDHFIDSMYMNADKDRLIQKAVPIKYTTQPIKQLIEPQFIEIHTPVTTSYPKGIILNVKVEDNELNSTSLESLKVLIPKKKYNREPINILDHKKAASSMFNSTLTVSPDMQNYISDLPELQSSSIYSSTLTVSPDMQNYISDLPELSTSSMFNSTLTVSPDMQNYIFDLPELQSSSIYSSTLTVSPNMQNYISDLPELPTSSMFSSTLNVTPDMQNYIPDLPELPSSSMFSSTPIVTPDTQNYNSVLPELPSSPKSNNFTSVNYASLSLQLKNEHLENQCKKLEKLLNKKTVTINNLKNRYLKLLNNKKIQLNSKLFIESMMFQSINSKSLVSMQINHKSHKQMNSDEKKLSLALYLKSPSMYSYLRRNKIILPGESIVQSWINPGYQRSLKLPVFAKSYY